MESGRRGNSDIRQIRDALMGKKRTRRWKERNLRVGGLRASRARTAHQCLYFQPDIGGLLATRN